MFVIEFTYHDILYTAGVQDLGNFQYRITVRDMALAGALGEIIITWNEEKQEYHHRNVQNQDQVDLFTSLVRGLNNHLHFMPAF